MEFGAISWAAVLVATIAFFAIGGLYYGPLFGDRWMAAAGMSREDADQPNVPIIFVGTLVLEAIAATGLAAILGEDPSVGEGAASGLVIGVLIVITMLGVNALYERRSFSLWVLNAGYYALGFVAMGAVIGWLQ